MGNVKIKITSKKTGKEGEVIKKGVPMNVRSGRVAMGGGGKKKCK